MKKTVTHLALLCALIAAPLAAQETQPDAPAEQAAPEGDKPETLVERASYIIGLNLGDNLRNDDIEVDADYLIRGLTDGLSGADALLSDDEMVKAMMEFQQKVQAEQQAKAEAAGAENQKLSEEFLKENAEREGVTVTDSGLQYEVIEEGEGPSPEADDQVTVHYEGRLIDGTVFDSSYERGQPASFQLNQVIDGWSEGLQLMNEGAKWKLFLPSDLAYGPQGAGDRIGPNQALVFDVELLDIEESESQAAPDAQPTTQPTE